MRANGDRIDSARTARGRGDPACEHPLAASAVMTAMPGTTGVPGTWWKFSGVWPETRTTPTVSWNGALKPRRQVPRFSSDAGSLAGSGQSAARPGGY